ncbi:copper chaperone CopZ [Runella defluvii]|uniref:Mercuric transport protein MerT n=1 Tax=Runella defluvii TaxID=370973 RepID=A0A7W5ZSF1_9BACT|nr:mercuric transport protein MerTP [Runella defluvii]MBB3841900.1 copper chaperone CopZ [Runella defluvii]
MKNTLLIPNLGILSAFASSLCCILPVFAFLAGTSGMASNISWLEPARPYFIGSTVLILGFAWYHKLNQKKEVSCNCEKENTVSFWQSKAFLSIITIVSVILLSFPSYSYLFFPKSQNQNSFVAIAETQKVEFTVKGMTCTGCEHHVKAEIQKLKGIIEVLVSYEKGNAIIKFEKRKTNVEEIEKAINSTGYKVVKHKILT